MTINNLLSAGRPTHRTAEHIQPAIKAMRETVRLNVDIPKQEYLALKRLALDADTSISAIVKLALKQHTAITSKAVGA